MAANPDQAEANTMRSQAGTARQAAAEKEAALPIFLHGFLPSSISFEADSAVSERTASAAMTLHPLHRARPPEVCGFLAK